MFHVATKLPFTDGDPQQVSRGQVFVSPQGSAQIPHTLLPPSSLAAAEEETHW